MIHIHVMNGRVSIKYQNNLKNGITCKYLSVKTSCKLLCMLIIYLFLHHKVLNSKLRARKLMETELPGIMLNYA